MTNFSHLDDDGKAVMVDISGKADSDRTAVAHCQVQLTPAIGKALADNSVPKGDVYAAARIAGIQAAKKCSDLIPLCHPLPLSKVVVEFDHASDDLITITATCKTTGKTGVEMEALTACSVAALTIYDMCKGIDKGIEIRNTRLLSKTGGKSGDWRSEND